jgi:AcrR family transcriptional regulator
MKSGASTSKMKGRANYRSPLRETQAGQTHDRIRAAAASLLDEQGSPDAITFKRVAAAAGVTEMTVYRHFPTREDLLRGIWEHLNAQMPGAVGMPATLGGLLAQHDDLYAGFDRNPAPIIASVTTPQGREMRAALDPQRRRAFSAIARGIAPHATPRQRERLAAILQLLHSAHAWMSLREQWDMDGPEAAAATRWAIEALAAAAAVPTEPKKEKSR